MAYMRFHSAVVSCVYYFALSLVTLPGSIASSRLEDLLAQGTKKLVNSQFAEAISLYSDAVNEDPNNYLPYYKRAMAFLASGKTRSAVSDLDKVIELKNDYYPVYKTRANANIKLGELEKAKSDFEALSNNDATAASVGLSNVNSLIEKYEQAKMLLDHGSYQEALTVIDNLIESITLNKNLLEWRATCHLKLGDHQRGIQDLRNSVHLVNDNRKGLLEVSKLMHQYGFAIQSLDEIRECLKLDQDDKECHQHYTEVKKLAKAITGAQDAAEAGKWSECIKKAQKIVELTPNMPVYQHQAEENLCHCMSENGSSDAVDYCKRVVERSSSVTEHKLHLANAYINIEDFDEAIKTYQDILGTDRHNQKAQEGMEKAQRMKKNMNKRDYYKILGVSRSAGKKEILKAYRKLAAEWHPDRYEEKDKKMAEKKFIDITDAKEVLTDEEKKRQFDMGIDPLDPEQAQGGGQSGHNPFRGGGGDPFSGFHFNGFDPFGGGGGGQHGGHQHFEFRFG